MQARELFWAAGASLFLAGLPDIVFSGNTGRVRAGKNAGWPADLGQALTYLSLVVLVSSRKSLISSLRVAKRAAWGPFLDPF